MSNQHGSVEWCEPTDVTGVDFSDLITISKGNVEVYDDNRHKNTKPARGQKLNKPAIIVINNVKPKRGVDPAKKEQSLRAQLEQVPEDGAQFLSYDQQTFEWTFKVLHFTKWGDEDSEEEDGSRPTAAIEEKKEERIQDFRAPFETSM